MSQLLINHNSDLQKLQSEGYDLEVRGGVIFIHHVPFLNQKHEVKSGSLAFVLRMVIPSVLQEITLPIGLEKNHVRN